MTNNYFAKLAAIVVTVALVGTLIWDLVFGGNNGTILGLTVFIIAVCTFFGFIIAGSSAGSKWKFDKSGMRTAIAATIIITYIFMLSFIQFLVGPANLTEGKKVYIDSFTSVVSVTIGFYLGGSALVQAFGKDDSTEDKSSEKKE